ncbi:PaaI family thioesterase [Henriciella aquimarina]|uniref:PaaI family thioesterase n=1 Tax=Henriciella aquimarina TaxID=545261 RepID=UPI000A013E5C|nr:PaaI family thioesterase [Henriciella aquimarina]
MNRAEELEAFLDRTPFAQYLGLRCEIMGDEMTTVLPFQDKFIGNAAIKALHGGCTGAFLELTAMAQVFLQSELSRPPKPINITIDYLRSAKGEDLYARAIVHKLGRRMASVRAEAWQAEREKPVAALQAHFLVAENG